MMKENFIAASANIKNLDSEAEGMPILTGSSQQQTLKRVMSNSFGFGGTNASLILERYSE